MIVLPSASPSRRGECTLVLGIHESARRRRGRQGAGWRANSPSGIKRRAKEVIIHFVLQPDDEAGLASCGNLHFAGGYEEGGQECDNT